MRQLKFVFGTINSPPVNASSEDLEELYQNSVFPFLNELYKYPEIKITQFYSGPFLDWLDRKHPEYIAVLTEMIKRKQVEILGGGYHMPILPLISPLDRLGQTELLTTTIRKVLGRRPRGFWLTKGIWDTSLSQSLRTAGMEFTFLEDSFFKALRAANKEWCQPRVTESQGKYITVFPRSHRLARLVFTGDWEGADQFFQSRSKKQNAFLSLLLPAQGFPDKDSAGDFYKNGGLGNLLRLIRDFWGLLDTVHPGLFVRKNKQALGKVYFSSSTFEDLEQMGYAEDLSELPRGKQNLNFRHFLALHNRSNLLYSKMIHSQVLAYQIRGDKYRKQSALGELWKAQSRDSFTQWDDGGWKQFANRTKVYSHLIKCEELARSREKFESSLSPVDFDMDGVVEYLYQGKKMNLYLDTKGGQFIEWDWLPGNWNYLCAFEPNREPAGNWAPGGLVDWMSAQMPTLNRENLREISPKEPPFGQYRLDDIDRDQKKITLTSMGEIITSEGKRTIWIKKSFRFLQSSFKFTIVLETSSPGNVNFVYGLENHLGFRLTSSKSLIFETDELPGEHSLQGELAFTGQKIHWKDKSSSIKSRISLSINPNGMFLPISEKGQDYQGHNMMLFFPVELESGNSWKLDGEWSLL